jgi:hypothetical protein
MIQHFYALALRTDQTCFAQHPYVLRHRRFWNDAVALFQVCMTGFTTPRAHDLRKDRGSLGIGKCVKYGFRRDAVGRWVEKRSHKFKDTTSTVRGARRKDSGGGGKRRLLWVAILYLITLGA